MFKYMHIPCQLPAGEIWQRFSLTTDSKVSSDARHCAITRAERMAKIGQFRPSARLTRSIQLKTPCCHCGFLHWGGGARPLETVLAPAFSTVCADANLIVGGGRVGPTCCFPKRLTSSSGISVMWLLIASALGALLISAMCSLMEAVLLSLRPGQIAEISAKHPRIGAVWQRFKADIDRPIAAILILNTAAHTIGASVAGAEFDRLYGDRWIWAFSLVFTLLMLQFTEILPKGAGVRFNRSIALWLAQPLAFLIRVGRPVHIMVSFINLPFSATRPKLQPQTTLDEIIALSSFARMSGEIDSEHEQIIQRGTRLSGSKVREVMRHRIDIDALDINTPPEEVVGSVAMSGFSRVPVYDGDLDDILGFIYIKDLLLELYMDRPVELQGLLRPVLIVPETLPLDDLLALFREQRTQMAVVLDEYGGTEGIVTMEDALERLVGAIHDEHRSEETEVTSHGEGRWQVIGSLNLGDLLDAIGRPDLRSAAPHGIRTVGGLILFELDRGAVAGDQITWHGLSLEVVTVQGRRVERALVTLVPDSQ
jgi:putative hemolysin